jgi:hypothetical protein
VAPKFKDLDEMDAAVRKAEGETLLCIGWDLRHVADESRLKDKARDRIKDKLRGAGLVVIPEVPDDQKHECYVTRAGSDVERVFNAYVRPEERNLSQVLASAGEGGIAAEQIEAVGELRTVLEEAGELLLKVEGVD